VPRPFHQLLREGVRRLPVSARNMSLDFKLRRTLAGLGHRAALWNPVWLAPVDPEYMIELFHDPLSPDELYSEAIGMWEASDAPSLVDRSLEFYTNFYLPDNILAKVDRASMLCSLETRAVLLDNDLVEFCRRLPHAFKFRNGRRKYLLKKALEGLIPQQIIDRPKKGFGIPTAKWLKTMPQTPPMASIPGMRMERVAASWKDHRLGVADHRQFLWSWLSLQWGEHLAGAASPALATQSAKSEDPAHAEVA
jgi:asparagine synthase (glutamine-hydrolysing)